jgi:hypothetical protein
MRTSTVRRRLAIPHGEPLLAWALAEYRGMRVPGPPMVPSKHWQALVALTPDSVWLSSAGDLRRFPLGEIVLASEARQPAGALRIDFAQGDPLVVLVADRGGFASRLRGEIRSFDKALQMRAPRALGMPDLPPDLVAQAGRAMRRANELRAAAGDDPAIDVEAQQSLDAARDLNHQARLAAVRELRGALLGQLDDHAASDSTHG